MEQDRSKSGIPGKRLVEGDPMSIRRMTLAWIFSMSGVALFLAVMSVAPLDVSAHNYIPATQAFDSPPLQRLTPLA